MIGQAKLFATTAVFFSLLGVWAGWGLRGATPSNSKVEEAVKEKAQEIVTKETIRFVTKDGPVVKETVTETRLVEKASSKSESKPVIAPLPRYIAGGGAGLDKSYSGFVGARIGNLPVFITGGVQTKDTRLIPTIGVLVSF